VAGQVCASHILIRVKTDPAATGHSEEEARKIAEGLLDQINGGASFEALAKKSSEDTFTGQQGGDLGCLAPGAMPAEFDDAVAAIDDGTLSDAPVRTRHGYHIIRVNKRTDETMPSLSEVKDRVRDRVLQGKLASAFQDAVNALATALERGGKLEDAAKAQDLTIQKSTPFAQGQVIEPLSPAAASKAFEMKPGQVDTEGQAVTRGHLFMSLLEVQPSRIPELKEVQEQVKADLVHEKAFEKAKARAAELKARAETAGLAGAATALGLTRKDTPSPVGHGQPWGDLGSSQLVEEAVFGLPEKALSDPLRVATGYAVARVLEKKPFDRAAFDKEKVSLAASLRESKKQKFLQAYLGLARQRFPVDVRVDVLKRVTG
jgi:peptidyl-prolyl cis-trans isomerase D